MSKSSSVTVVVHKKSKANSNDSDMQQIDDHKVEDGDDKALTDVTNNVEKVQVTDKASLLALFKVPALPIKNSMNSAVLAEVNQERLKLYRSQHERTKQLYMASYNIRPTYLVNALKSQFVEYERYLLAKKLDRRHVANTEELDVMWLQLHIVDDLIAEIVRHMPAQTPVGWQLTSGSRNHLNLPTVGRLRDSNSIADQGSIISYVLGHFGVMSYTFDRGYFIGHVLGYLFCCYYFAYLSIAYGVTPLPKIAVPEYEYASLDTAKMVRLLQALDLHSKRRVYQLAVLCGRLSEYRTDKRIEKLLIAEVNDFDKKVQQNHLDDLIYQGAMPENLDELDDMAEEHTSSYNDLNIDDLNNNDLNNDDLNNDELDDDDGDH